MQRLSHLSAKLLGHVTSDELELTSSGRRTNSAKAHKCDIQVCHLWSTAGKNKVW